MGWLLLVTFLEGMAGVSQVHYLSSADQAIPGRAETVIKSWCGDVCQHK